MTDVIRASGDKLKAAGACRAVPGHSSGSQLASSMRCPGTLSHLVLLDTGGDSHGPPHNPAGQRRQASPAGLP